MGVGPAARRSGLWPLQAEEQAQREAPEGARSSLCSSGPRGGCEVTRTEAIRAACGRTGWRAGEGGPALLP